MKHLAAYLLAILGGNNDPDEAAIKAILSSIGGEADSAKIQQLLKELKGKDINEIIKEGSAKLVVTSGGGGGSAAAASATGGEAAAEPEPEEEEEEESEADLGGGGLFGGSDDDDDW